MRIMNNPIFTFKSLEEEVVNLCKDLRDLCNTPGPTRCVAKLSQKFDPRISSNNEFPFIVKLNEIIIRMNKKNPNGNKLFLFQDYGNIILVSGFKKKPSLKQIKEIPFVLASHADEISYIKKKNSMEIIPLFNYLPIVNTGFDVFSKATNVDEHGTFSLKSSRGVIRHNKVKIFGFIGDKENRDFKQIGSGNIYRKVPDDIDIKMEETNDHHKKLLEEDKQKKSFYLENIEYSNPDLEKRGVLEGDLIIQDYDETEDNFNINSIIHAKALDDRVGVISHLYTLNELNKNGIAAKAIMVGDEEGVNSDIAWAKLSRPVFRKYCKEEDIIIICDGFDGKKLTEFEQEYGFKNGDCKHFDMALIAPYRSEGKGAGDPGMFALFRDEIIRLADENGFKAVTTTDYVSRSFDPKIMDDFPNICSIDWSNGPVVTPTKKYYNECHVDESVSIKQVVNIIGTSFWTIHYLNQIYLKKK